MKTENIKLLIVDDSPLIQNYLTDILSEDDEIKIVGKAQNGKEAIKMVTDLTPDIVIMEIVMPEMGGLEATRHIMSKNAVPILIFTNAEDANIAFKAISVGALDLLPKFDLNIQNSSILINKIKLLSKIKVITHLRSVGNNENQSKTTPAQTLRQDGSWKVVAIAASTGGVKALSKIIPFFPENFSAPIVIAQHIAKGFIVGLVNFLNGTSLINIKVAEEGEEICPGTVYFSKPEENMIINSAGKVEYKKSEKNVFFHPSCNRLLSSIAHSYAGRSIGVILTGMGDDGAEGVEKIKKAGGVTIAQDEETSVIFSMPHSAIAKGCIDKILPIERIHGEIMELVIR